jgi:hypothetical protein
MAIKDAYYFPHFCNARHDRKIRRVLKDLGIEGYGIYFMILEVLREQTDLKYPIADIDLLADEFGTSQPKISTIVCNYELFKIDETEHFYSPKLVVLLQPFFEKKEQNRVAGIASGRSRAAKIAYQNEHVFNKCSTDAEQREEKRREEKKRKEIKTKTRAWRCEYAVYREMVIEETKKLINDEQWISENSKLYPDLNVKMTVIKACKDYWLTEDGWENKKRRRGEPNWKSTYRNAIGQKFNWVSAGTHFFDGFSNYAEL